MNGGDDSTRALCRWLGTLGMIGAPAVAVSLVLIRLGYIRDLGPIDGLFSFVYAIGFLSTAIALRALRVTGDSRTGAIVSAAQIAGLAFAVLWALLASMGGQWVEGRAFTLTDLAWPFSHLFMLAVALAAWRAKLWSGWPVFCLFICGCALPAAAAARMVAGEWGVVITFGTLTAIPLTLTALKVRRT